MIGVIVLVVLLLLLFGALPQWPHSANWGWGPSSVLGIVLIILLLMFLMGRI